LIAAAWLAAVWSANTDLSEGRFAIYMDEGIIFDGVNRILHPGHFAAFLDAVLDGGDQRYGRILWNLIAVTAYLPEKLWGASGLIVAERMTQAVLYLTATIILSLTFVRHWAFRAILAGALLVLPFADYYATMPKPEPLELMLLAIFFWLHKARNYAFGPHWLFLGLAFGAKIAVLPLIPVLALYAAFQSGAYRKIATDPNDVIDCCAAFLLGLGLAVPILLRPIGTAVGMIYLWRWAAPNNPAAMKIAGAAAALLLGCLSGIGKIDTWLDFTFRNTAHGRDEAKINFFSWVDYLFHNWLAGPAILNIIVVASAGLLFSLTVWDKRREKAWLREPGLLLVCGGAAMIGAIFVSSHRLWGFYLVPGMVLALTGLLCLVEQQLYAIQKSAKFGVGSSAALVTLVSCIVLAIVGWLPNSAHNLQAMARRTEAVAYRTEYASYRVVIDTLASQAKILGRPVEVVLDPNLFRPEDTELYRINAFWGPYKDWAGSADLVVFGPSHLPGGQATPPDSPEYPAFLAERAAYARFVIAPGSVCSQAQCYVRIAKLPDGGEILARSTSRNGG
jgi:hypothetical protein